MNTKPRNTKKKESPGSKISSAVGNYEDHPFFVKKADEAKKNHWAHWYSESHKKTPLI